jgi:hypothetical protein
MPLAKQRTGSTGNGSRENYPVVGKHMDIKMCFLITSENVKFSLKCLLDE